MCSRNRIACLLGLLCALVSCRKGPTGEGGASERASSPPAASTSTMTGTQSNPADGDPVLPGVAKPSASLDRRLRAAIAERGPDYRPRTHHLEPGGAPTYVNRLIRETSPYLLQHAHNPVNFYPWGPEALARAKRENKPILLSIGYSTCHWCHVMERESFEDEEIAAYLNGHYVSIKVDREERPDLDDVYMAAVTLLTGRGGWPMTVVLTPELKPFFGGTYFPARDGDRGARLGFLSILKQLQARFASEPDKVASRAEQVSQAMREAAAPQKPSAVPGYGVIASAAEGLARRFDPTLGGFGRAPKFPQPDRVSLLLRYFRRTGDEAALRMALRTLRAMAAGGMHDQVGGGFHRYSTDARWLVPHFEKMLYDNALLTVAYLEGYQATRDEELARVADATLTYVLRDMTSPDGGFYSATDADSDTPSGHQEEGYHFTWTPTELEAALGPDELSLVRALFDVSDGGNFEGRTILALKRPKAAVAKALGIPPDTLHKRLDACRAKLLEARKARAYPGRDDKVLTAWNGLMISALAQASIVLGRPTYASAAAKAADFVWAHLRDDGGKLLRSYNAGRAQHNGFVEDHAFLIAGLLDLFEASQDHRHLKRAVQLQQAQDAHFWDDAAGGYFMTRNDHEALLMRDKPHYDGAVPSGNAVATSNLLRLAELTGDMTHRTRAEQCLAAFAAPLTRSPLGGTRMLAALDRYLDVPREVVIVHPPQVDPEPLMAVVRRTYLPNRLLLLVSTDDLPSLAQQVPLVQDKVALNGRPTAYVCEQGRCKLPTSDPKTLAQQLSARRPVKPAPPPLTLP